MTTITVRQAGLADTDGVRAVGLAAWPPTYVPLTGPEYVEWALATWWSIEATERGIATGDVLVAEVGGRIVGMAGLGAKDGVPVLWKLYVLPGMQGAGVGSALMAAVFDRLRRRGDDRLRLEYLEGNERAAAFYRAHGFREIGRTTDPERPGVPEDVWMEVAL
ncbi:MAG: GNAT family N-acetyltransferase [Hamadaea sp.]|uniref:GNAT family N-acetyltransferase n=1 Tax=Hamadaea sp. TaxID=2024425 RepID=UPI0017D1E463|nr:GNAT family N-acetyltransferase [Hamadaea sp.]NUR71032.1 GNAT family N-acetyltransferase [Hamadaea sp.]NUT23713.1 GNAT family N-acetyltransferase [Hamadaea sp.]